MMMTGIIAIVVAAGAADLVADANFSRGTEAWQHSAASPEVVFDAGVEGGRTFARIVVPETAQPAYPLFW